MSVAIKMVTYEEELKLLKEKINARKAKAEAKAKAKSDTKAHAQANKDELKLQNLAEKDLGAWYCRWCKRKFKYKERWTHHMQEARIARINLIDKEIKRRESRKELDDFKGKAKRKTF